MKIAGIIVSCLIAVAFFAQKPEVSLSCNSKQLEVGEELVLTVKSNVSGHVNIDLPDSFIPGTGMMNGMEQQMDYQTGKLLTIYYFSQNGAFKEKGSFSITAYVNRGSKVYKSNTLRIKVEENQMPQEHVSRKVFEQPVFGVILRSKPKIYVGEPLILESKVYSRVFLSDLEGYNSFEILTKTEAHEMNQQEKLYRNHEVYKGENFYTITKGKKLHFINVPGKYKVKPFEMLLEYDNGGFFAERFKLTSLSSSIEVMELPEGAPDDFAGLIGKYQMEAKLDRKTGKEGDVLRLELVLSGKGNLHNMDTPKLKLSKGLMVYGDPEIEEQIDFGMSGAEGSLVYRFNVQLLEGGKQKIDEISLSYFDPEEEKYKTLKQEGFELQVKGTPKPVYLADQEEEQQEKESSPLILETGNTDDSGNTSMWSWSTYASPLLIAFIGGLFWRRKKNLGQLIVEKNRQKKLRSDLFASLKALKERDRTAGKEAYMEMEQLLRSAASLMQEGRGEMSKGEFLDFLVEQGVEEPIRMKVARFFKDCEEARYSYVEDQDRYRQLCDELESMLIELT
ncbi:MAG: hypothetical protein EP338_03495 [Bacteroidetes bacterium]|nr:MAG: hypothetical protein EP338_03495 [Bacteroidota bacterium]